MTQRQLVAILAALLRAQNPHLDPDAAVIIAISIAGGVGLTEHDLEHILNAILGGARIATAELLADVDRVLAMRAASRQNNSC